MPVKFYKDHASASNARVTTVVPDSFYGFSAVIIQDGDTSIEVVRKDFEAFIKAFTQAAEVASAAEDRLKKEDK